MRGLIKKVVHVLELLGVSSINPSLKLDLVLDESFDLILDLCNLYVFRTLHVPAKRVLNDEQV